MKEFELTGLGLRKDKLMDIAYSLVVLGFFALTWGLVDLVGKL